MTLQCPRQVVDIRLERTALLHLLGRSVTLEDLIELDPHRCRGLKWILEQDTIGELGDDLTFSVDLEVFGEMVTVDLKPGGRDQSVTDDNRQVRPRIKIFNVQFCELYHHVTHCNGL